MVTITETNKKLPFNADPETGEVKEA